MFTTTDTVFHMRVVKIINCIRNKWYGKSEKTSVRISNIVNLLLNFEVKMNIEIMLFDTICSTFD